MLEWPKLHEEYLDKAKMEKWEHFIAIRGEITKVLENARREKTIGHSLDAKVDLYATGEAYELLKPLEKDLPTLLIVSQAAIHEGTDSGMKTERDDLTVAVAAAEGENANAAGTMIPPLARIRTIRPYAIAASKSSATKKKAAGTLSGFLRPFSS